VFFAYKYLKKLFFYFKKIIFDISKSRWYENIKKIIFLKNKIQFQPRFQTHSHLESPGSKCSTTYDKTFHIHIFFNQVLITSHLDNIIGK
jgi:hypothetical protein